MSPSTSWIRPARPRDGLVDYWVQRGLRRGGPEDLLHAADRWSATFDRGNGTFVVTAADGELALTGSYNPVRDRDWLDAIEHTGKLVVLVGRLADDGGDITTESLQTAAGAGGVARGVVRLIDR